MFDLDEIPGVVSGHGLVVKVSASARDLPAFKFHRVSWRTSKQGSVQPSPHRRFPRLVPGSRNLGSLR